MKILHCADLHLGDLTGPIKDGKNARRADTLRCMDTIVKSAEEKKPDISIIAGDLFNRSRVWADTALDDISAAITEFIKPLCMTSGYVVLLFGTQNHDNPKAFETLRHLTQGINNLKIYTTPKCDTIPTKDGVVQLLAMPGFDKGRLRAFMPNADAETENKNATALVNEIIAGLAAETCANETAARILVAHYTVAGAEGENGQSFLAGQDVVILPQTIDMAGVTLGCFGHIHKPQRLTSKTPAYYSGSPNELTFNDAGIEHGFYYHTIEGGEVIKSEFMPTPSRKHHTVHLTRDMVTEFITTGDITATDAEAYDAIVRVYYDCTAEQDKQLNRAALQNWLLDKKNYGAFYVADFVRKEADYEATLTEAATEESPTAALHRYLNKIVETSDNMTEADMSRIEELATPIIRQADDGRETDKRVGAFIPQKIVIDNYRSYSHAEFDFKDIRMAMVNGQNGVGKSSLFMDAIADCLYETSRDGAIGEWLRVGEKKGSIIFEFEMGGISYRVSRTRTASGKGTLALARFDPDTGEWVNESDTTMRLTQDKIIKVIGMDCQTFCSIALIRQDAYGLFLDADSDRRMEVLSTLLDLGLYSRAEEIAKALATDQRRAIAQINDRMNILQEQIDKGADIHNEMERNQVLAEANISKKAVANEQIKATEKEEALRQELISQAEKKEQEILELEKQINEKSAELIKQEKERDAASEMSAMLPSATKAVADLERARKDLEALAPNETRLADLIKEKIKADNLILNYRKNILDIRRNIEETKKILKDKEEIEAAVATIDAVRESREKLMPLQTEYNELTAKIRDLKAKRDKTTAEYKAEIETLQNSISTAQRKTDMLTSSGCPIANKATCEFLKDAQAAKIEVLELNTKLGNKKAEARQVYDKATTEIEAIEATVARIPNPIEELDTLIQKERTAAPIAAQAARLAGAEAKMQHLKKDEADTEKAMAEIKSEVESTTKEIRSLTWSAEKAKNLRSTIKDLEPIAALKPQCVGAEATVKALTVTVDLLHKDITKTQEKATQAHMEAEEIKSRIPSESSNLEALRDELKKIESMDRYYAGVIGGLEAQLKAIEQQKEQWEVYRDEKAEVARKLRDYEILAGAFGLDGIQYNIIRNTVPEIQEKANSILAAMTGGRMAVDFKTERELKNKKMVNSLDVWINSITGGSRPYNSHSGGEKVKIALAVTLGLADVKAHRAGVQLGMLWIDEPPFLDGDGTEAYADALVNMANRNPQMRILAISHDPQLKARFAQNITVTAGENGSEVTMD